MNRAERRQQKKQAGKSRTPKKIRAGAGNLAKRVEQAYQLHMSGKRAEAAGLYREILAADPRQPTANHLLGVIAHEDGDFTQAKLLFSRAVAGAPKEAANHNNLGLVLYTLGELDAAATSFRKAIALKHDYSEAHRYLSNVTKHTEPNDDLLAMEALFRQNTLNDQDRMNLGFGLGKAYDDLGRYDDAFACFSAANKILGHRNGSSAIESDSYFQSLMSVYNSELFDGLGDVGCKDTMPIFVLGMPRSGTTLVEQILASHSQVGGAGELSILATLNRNFFDASAGHPTSGRIAQAREAGGTEFEMLGQHYVEAARHHVPDTGFVVDKMPSNFQLIGLIHMILPKAKIVHCVRDPRDTCLSIFKSFFSGSGLGYASDPTELGRYYLRYRDLMAHWHRELPGRIHDIRYEDLISDQEGQTRTLLEHCDLEWEDSCLAFHRTERAVKTNAEVRQPIYRDSVEAWRHYERGLGSLFSVVGANG